MNYVAIAAWHTKVSILAFVLMSNHVHFVLECDLDRARAFINTFKNMYSLYRRKQYGDKEYLRSNKADFQEITIEGEALARAIAYVQMNCVAARLCVHPIGYPWGTGNVFFSATYPSGFPIGKMSGSSRARLLRSKQAINPEWLMGNDGYILPASYVAVKFVESLFRSPGRYQFFLDNSSKAKKNRDQIVPSFSDQLILTASLNLCHSLFRAVSVDDLSPSQTADLVKQLHRRFSSDAAQISRVTGIPYQETVRALDSF